MKTGKGVVRGKWYVIRKGVKTLAILLTTYHLSRTTLCAADFQISASLDKSQVALNEQTVLSIHVSGSGNSLPNPKLPALAGFQVYNAGRSQNFSWINGQASASVTHNFVLTPLQEGTFKIPPIVAEKDGQTAQTGELTLRVTSASSSSAVPGGGSTSSMDPRQGHSGMTDGRTAAIFITGTVDKASVYVGEPVVYTFRLFNRVPLLRQPGYQAPDVQGLWKEDLPPQRNFKTTVKGVPYNVTEIRTALFPTAPGKARIGSAQLQVMLENVGGDPFSSDFFASFFGRGEEKVLRTEPLSISAKALPEPKPAAFNGAVGHYTLSSSLDKTETSVGQPVTMTVTISGRGNIKSLPEISFPALPNFRTLADNAAVHVENQNDEVRGSKVFKTVLIPTTSGDLTIPTLSYVYFDTEAKAYKTLASKAFTLKVLAGTGPQKSADPSSPLGPAASPSRTAGIQRLAEDIHYIRTSEKISSQGRPLYQHAWFRWLHFFSLMGIGGFGFIRLYQRLFLSDRAAARFKNAKGTALIRLAKADKADAMAQTLQDYLADKLNLESRELSLRSAQEKLRTRSVSAHTLEKIRSLWETLDLYRFAPAQTRTDDVSQAKIALGQLIEGLEKEILWKV